MTAHPLYPRPGHGPPGPPQRPVRPPLNPADVAIGVTLYALALVLAVCSGYLGLFFAFAADSCRGDTDCGFVTDGMGLAWGGAALGVIVGAVMLPVAAWRHWWVWIWGVVPNILVIGGFVAGYLRISQAIG